MIAQKKQNSPYVTVNPCRLCAPLGAGLAFKGIEGAMSLVHGSQGCATYIRRYIISHFREPIDIASSSFTEDTAVFGGGDNLRKALLNMIARYTPRLIGIATTCLSETIGDDVGLWIRRFKAEFNAGPLPPIVAVSTPSYKGSHESGFHDAVDAVVRFFAGTTAQTDDVFLLPPMLSPADLRALRELCALFGLSIYLVPDYSDTLDGGTWDRYHALPPGGTPLSALREIGGCRAVIELGAGSQLRSAGLHLKSNLGRTVRRIPVPVGMRATDEFLDIMSSLSGTKVPECLKVQRARLADAYVDGHKYVFEKRVALFGDEDTVAMLATFCAETGMAPVLCATGAATGRLRESLAAACPDPVAGEIVVADESDFDTIEHHATRVRPDLCIGTSKGYPLSRRLGIPPVRAGFPVHDRFGAGRFRMTGYDGAMDLFDRIVNELLRHKQDTGEVGYSYL